METLRQVAGSLALAAFSALLVIGGISLALAESYVPEIPTPTETPAFIPDINTATPTPQALIFITDTLPLPLPSVTIPPPTNCPPPTGWIPTYVQAGETLAEIAVRHKATSDQVKTANCLFSNDVLIGSVLYVPPLPTRTSVSCGKPTGWVSYTVQAGNTMYSLSHAYGISVAQLQFANCIPSYRYSIVVGQSLWVPYIAMTRTPLATATATLTPVSIIFPTLTYTSTVTKTATATYTVTAHPTSTFTATATLPPPTTTPTATATSLPTQTPIP